MKYGSEKRNRDSQSRRDMGEGSEDSNTVNMEEQGNTSRQGKSERKRLRKQHHFGRQEAQHG